VQQGNIGKERGKWLGASVGWARGRQGGARESTRGLSVPMHFGPKSETGSEWVRADAFGQLCLFGSPRWAVCSVRPDAFGCGVVVCVAPLKMPLGHLQRADPFNQRASERVRADRKMGKHAPASRRKRTDAVRLTHSRPKYGREMGLRARVRACLLVSGAAPPSSRTALTRLLHRGYWQLCIAASASSRVSSALN
jgi:hypothetical protein